MKSRRAGGSSLDGAAGEQDDDVEALAAEHPVRERLVAGLAQLPKAGLERSQRWSSLMERRRSVIEPAGCRQQRFELGPGREQVVA
jgi:hypothetical protein